mgnify:CR=1 FL=1
MGFVGKKPTRVALSSDDITDGVIVKTNQNTSFRREMQRNEKDFQAQMQEVESLRRWRDGVNKALWILFGLIGAIVLNMIMMHSDKI